MDRRLKVGVVEDDERRLASELEMHARCAISSDRASSRVANFESTPERSEGVEVDHPGKAAGRGDGVVAVGRICHGDLGHGVAVGGVTHGAGLAGDAVSRFSLTFRNRCDKLISFANAAPSERKATRSCCPIGSTSGHPAI